MLTTLANVKQQFNIASGNTTQDVWLGFCLGAASTAIRKYCKRWLGAVADSLTVASPTVLTCRGHGLYTGDTVVISRSNSVPVADGTYVITVIDDNTFSVPFDVSTTAGTYAYIQRQFTEFYCGDNTQRLCLNHRPVCSISDLRVDQLGYFGTNTANDYVPFDSTTLKVEGTDYVLKRDQDNSNAPSKSGIVYAINNVWPQILVRFRGFLTTGVDTGRGNIRVIYTAGYMPIDADLQSVTCDYIAQMNRQRFVGAPLQSEHYDFYSYDLFKPGSSKTGGGLAVVEMKRKLAPYKELVL